MNIETLLPCLLWYCFVGYFVAQVHKYQGIYSRYNGLKSWFVWWVFFIGWPAMIPPYLVALRQQKSRS